MMLELMKYVRYGDEVVMFPGWVNHSAMVAAVNRADGKVDGAGFVSLVDGEIVVYGKSMTLGVGSTPECAAAIRNLLR